MRREFETVVIDTAAAEREAMQGGRTRASRHGRGRGRRRAAKRPRRLVIAVAVVAVAGGGLAAAVSSGGGPASPSAAAGAPSAAVMVTFDSSAQPTGAPSSAVTATTKPTGTAGATATATAKPTRRPSVRVTGRQNRAAPKSSAPVRHTGGANTGSGTPVAGTPATGTAARFAQQIVDAVNAERAKAGCRPLTVNAKLQAVAQQHSDDMAARNYYEHDTPEGVDPGTRMTNAGYDWRNWGENIYESPKDPATAMDGWMNSPAHRDNILDCQFTQTGVGVNLSANGPWWTEDFARPE